MDLIDRFIDRYSPTARPVASTGVAAPLESALGFRLPKAYRHLVERFEFPDFDVAGITIWGSSPSEFGEPLVRRMTRDAHLFPALRASGLIQIGRLATGSYDPICIHSGERRRASPVVRVDHEACLQWDEARIESRLARSLEDLIAEALAGEI